MSISRLPARIFERKGSSMPTSLANTAELEDRFLSISRKMVPGCGGFCIFTPRVLFLWTKVSASLTCGLYTFSLITHYAGKNYWIARSTDATPERFHTASLSTERRRTDSISPLESTPERNGPWKMSHPASRSSARCFRDCMSLAAIRNPNRCPREMIA
jgi:hypothetical protein